MRDAFLRFVLAAAAALGLINANVAAAASPTCHGKFVNPITDICWSCVLPLSIGSARAASSAQEDIDNPSNPLCGCAGPPPQVGISLGFWEPARQIDVTRTPFCLVGLGGLQLDPGFRAPRGDQKPRTDGASRPSFYQAHFYQNVMLYWLEVLLDFPCLEKGSLDLVYLTEVDPLWNDDELTALIHPEVVIFANPVAQTACAADCVAATAGFPVSQLFWCAGCQGSIYPMHGVATTHVGGAQASTLIATRLLAKMHRELVTWAYAGTAGLCGPYFLPMMDKRHYKLSMTYPVPQTKKIAGQCCQPIGRSTILWGAGREFPIEGEDFSYLVFRKRNCCAW